MKIKLTNKQYDFLQKYLAIERPDLCKFFVATNNFAFEIDDDTASEIKDWAGDKLQRMGFDSNYELNEAGIILKELEDLFYK